MTHVVTYIEETNCWRVSDEKGNVEWTGPAASAHDAAVKCNAARAANCEDVAQVIYALERAQAQNERHAARLLAAGRYDAEFPASDAEQIGKAIAIVRASAGAPTPP